MTRTQEGCRSRSMRSRSKLANRRGVSTLQLILVLPILVIVGMATFEFGIMMVVQQTVTTATILGARAASREATKAAANTAAEAEVDRVLALHGLAIIDGDVNSDTRMVLEYRNDPVSVITGDPGLACSTPTSPAMTAADVRLTICVDLTTAPLVNFLSTLGLDFSGKRLQITSATTME